MLHFNVQIEQINMFYSFFNEIKVLETSSQFANECISCNILIKIKLNVNILFSSRTRN